MHDALLRPFTTAIELSVASHTTWKHVLLSALCSISECSVDGVEIYQPTKGVMISDCMPGQSEPPPFRRTFFPHLASVVSDCRSLIAFGPLTESRC
jgi:hypothetical protein